MDKLKGRTAVVIGGGSGIGRGTALGLAAEGMNVVVADIDPETAGAVRDEILGRGGVAVAEPVDGTDRASLAELARRAVDHFASVHVLCNNVGVVVSRPLDQATEADWGWVIEFNFMSIVRAVDEFLPTLRVHGEGGHIVNTASMAALTIVTPTMANGTHLGLYTATKHAILGYTAILRDELAGDSIGVSVLCPGMIQSNLGHTSARHRPDRYGGQMESLIPEGATIPGQMPNEELGPYVVQGIRENRLYILTHPDPRPFQARLDELLADARAYER